MEITSVNNDLVKETAKLQQKKYRDLAGMFLLEGFKAVEEAHLSGLEVVRFFVQKEKRGKYMFLRGECVETTDAVLKKISTTTTPPEIVAVVKKPELKRELGKKIVLFEGIKDSGNLGTIIRSAVAFGVDSVILYGDTVDLYNPKVVRSAVGNLWKINVVEVRDFAELKGLIEEYDRIATLPKSKDSMYLADFELGSDKNVLMFGEESSGLSEELKAFATKSVTIEMSESVESLNLSVSAGVLMYELFR